MECTVISTVEGWTRHRKEINGLLSSTNNRTPHSTSQWLVTWWRAFGGEHSLRVGLFWDAGQLVGYAPLMLSREKVFGIHYRQLCFLGEGLSDYADIFCLNDDLQIKHKIIRIILTEWEWEWDRIYLTNIREGSNTITAFEAQQAHYAIDVESHTRCLFMQLSDTSFNQFYKSLNKNRRNEFQKIKQKLDAPATSWSLQFNPSVSPDKLLEVFGDLHTARAVHKGFFVFYQDERFRHFFLDLFATPQDDFELLWTTITHDGSVISYMLGFVMNKVYFQWNIGFSENYKMFSPNKVHHLFLIEECFKRGYKEFDFMRGDSKYKFDWTKSFRRNYRVRILKKGKLLGKLFYLRSLAWKMKSRAASGFRFN